MTKIEKQRLTAFVCKTYYNNRVVIFMKLLIIQADNRQIYMREYLEKQGFECTVFNVNLLSGDNERQFDGVIFALPTIKNSRINCEYEINIANVLSLVKKGGCVFYAMSDEAFENAVRNAELEMYDFYKREELIIRNAYATAQAVLELVLINSNVMVDELKFLITGYGKTGEAIADVLLRNHSDITVAARKIRDRARIVSRGMKAIDFDEIRDYAPDFDVVINTVPEKVIGKNLLESFSQNCLFLEIASAPYGIDIHTAQKQNKQIIIASSLPGKYVACSAGKFIAQTIMNLIKEESING